MAQYLSCLAELSRPKGLRRQHGNRRKKSKSKHDRNMRHRVDEHGQAVADFARFAAGPAGVLCGVDVAFRVRHQPQHAAARVAHAGDVAHRSVGIVGKRQPIVRVRSDVSLALVAEHELAGRVQLAPIERAVGVGVVNLGPQSLLLQPAECLPRRRLDLRLEVPGSHRAPRSSGAAAFTALTMPW